ncbi:MAG: glutamate racemase [Oscillospiraceae bacterium]|nr:glutamate racemase [Oscillospiraceae bacterium]
MDNRAIGVFDSGLGGLTVLKAIRDILPKESIVYFGDCGRTPYGVKSKETILNYTYQNVRFLMEMDIKLLVIACNTSSAYAYELIKKTLSIPVIEVIKPGARAGRIATRNGKVGVIGTNATIESGAYIKAIRELDPGIEVFSRACPLFVPLVEEGEFWWDNDVTEKVARVYLEGFKEDGIDTLVLGCTHYPLLRGAIQRVMGKDTVLVSSAEEAAKSVKRALQEFDIEAVDEDGRQKLSLYTSDSVEKFEPLCSSILKCRIEELRALNVNIEEY